MERVLEIKKSPNPRKKYRAIVASPGARPRAVDFGATGYEQFRDSTKLRIYENKNHGDKARRRNYFLRHSGVPTKAAALAKERGKRVTAKYLSHKFLW